MAYLMNLSRLGVRSGVRAWLANTGKRVWKRKLEELGARTPGHIADERTMGEHTTGTAGIREYQSGENCPVNQEDVHAISLPAREELSGPLVGTRVLAK